MNSKWFVNTEWSGEQLASRFADVKWDISHSATEGSVSVPMAEYLNYLAQQNDEEPLYIFDSG